MLFLKRAVSIPGERRISGTPIAEPIKCAALDFDGTLTDVEKEAVPFREKYYKGFAKMIRLTENGLSPLWEIAEKKILSDPAAHGWKMDGRIVAPAYPDPFIFATVTATEVLDMLDLLTESGERFRRMDALFHSSYAGLETTFREGASDFVARLMEELELSIATSSEAGLVQSRLEKLKLKKMPQVYGSAQKYVLDHSWGEMQESFRPDGYGRPVYLRRKKYWDILESIRKGRAASEMIVIGDIYELDLALPHFSGMRTCLAARENTPPHHIAAAGSGLIVAELGAAAEQIIGYKRAA